MKVFFYDIFLFLFRTGVRIAALFNSKARLWLAGRESIFDRLEIALNGQSDIVWMHCASLGEFEQGRPVLEKLRMHYPSCKILLTFFSPSGYETMKHYKGADWIFYLPLDGKKNASHFLEIVRPQLVIFVKYEYWYHYLSSISKRRIPLLMVSAIFRPDSPFFKWYGGLHRRMLNCFTHLFVQNDESVQLLSSILPSGQFSKAGDTRFDRVIDIAEKAEPVPLIEEFTRNANVIVAGSTWPPDEIVLQKTLGLFNHQLKLIIAPHQINDEHIRHLQHLYPGCLLYSELVAGSRKTNESDTLVINNIGLLSRIYRYAHTCYIGGAFQTGLHNTLEAAVYGKPVFFGPDYKKFMEAGGLIQYGAAFSITDENMFSSILKRLIADTAFYNETCESAKKFVYLHKGATGKVLSFIQEKRLLTS